MFFILLSVILFTLPEAPQISPFIPGENEGIELFIMAVVAWPLIAIIGIFIGGYIISPIFLLIHKKLIGRKMVFGLQNIPESSKFTNTFRGFFPSLMALTLIVSYLLRPDILEMIVPTDNLPTEIPETLVQMIFGIFTLLTLTLVISIIVFSGAWNLLDAEIISFNKKIPNETNTVGNWYLNFLKGYAGLSIFYAYYTLLTAYFQSLAAVPIQMFIIDFIALIPSSFLIMLSMIPALILFDMNRDKRIEFIRNFAERIGIVDQVQITCTKVNE